LSRKARRTSERGAKAGKTPQESKGTSKGEVDSYNKNSAKARVVNCSLNHISEFKRLFKEFLAAFFMQNCISVSMHVPFHKENNKKTIQPLFFPTGRPNKTYYNNSITENTTLFEINTSITSYGWVS